MLCCLSSYPMSLGVEQESRYLPDDRDEGRSAWKMFKVEQACGHRTSERVDPKTWVKEQGVKRSQHRPRG